MLPQSLAVVPALTPCKKRFYLTTSEFVNNLFVWLDPLSLPLLTQKNQAVPACID